MDRLYAIIRFAGIPIGGTQQIAHGLVINGRRLTPDRVDLQFPNTFEVVAATTTTVTLRNVADGVGDCQAWCEVLHPVMRSFGSPPDDGSLAQHLDPQPFLTGATTSPPFPVNTPVVTTIYARTTGSDETGDGSLAHPYRTFKHAILQVPNVIAAGYAYIVDVTGLTEPFPVTGYALPPFQASVQEYLFLDPSTLPFAALAALNIRATPRSFSGLPSADTTVPAGDIVAITSIGPGLTSVQVAPPRASWAADGAKTAMIIGSAGDAQVNCVVYGSDATHLFLCNTPSHVTSQTLSLVEPSAVFASAGPGGDGSGFDVSAAPSLAIQGIKFTIAGGGSDAQLSLGISNTLLPVTELCDIDGLVMSGVQLQCLTLSNVIRNFVFAQASSWTPRRSLLLDSGFGISGGPGQVFRQVVLDGCAALGPGLFATNEGALFPGGWELLNVLIRNSTGDGFAASQAGAYSLQEVQIDDSVGDGLSVRDLVMLKTAGVTGTGNGGVGLRVNDGAFVRVLDDATNITGTGGDMKVGTLPVRTWVDFRTLVPTKNQFDLQTPFVVNVASGLSTPGGDDVGGAGSGGCSGSRVFQRP